MTLTEPFMLWTPEIVTQVKRCWAETLVDDSLMALAEASDNITDSLFYSFDAIVRSMVFRVHLDKRDCLLTTNSDRSIHGTILRIEWRPTTQEVEFHVGPAAGMTISIPKLGDPYKVSIKHVPEYTKDESTGDLDIPEIFYNYDGWNPNTRRWIYRVK